MLDLILLSVLTILISVYLLGCIIKFGIPEYEAVKIKYTFDVIADSKQELKALRKQLLAWIHSKGDNKLYDTDISDTAFYEVYHAQGSWSEEGLQGLLTAEFTCYPFMKTEKETVVALSSTTQTVNINNEGDRDVYPSITVAGKNLFDTLAMSNSGKGTNHFVYSNLATTPNTSDIYISAVTSNSIVVTTKSGYTGNGVCITNKKLAELAPSLKVGDICFLCGDTMANVKGIYLFNIGMWTFGEAKTITAEMLAATVYFYGLNELQGQGTGNCTISNVHISKISNKDCYISKVANGSFTVIKSSTYTGKGVSDTGKTLREFCPQLESGKVYTLTAKTTAYAKRMYLYGADYYWHYGDAQIITEEMLNSVVYVYGINASRGDGYGELTISNIQIELGETATEYTAHIDANATIKSGANSYAVSAGKYTDLLKFKKGQNTLTASGTGLMHIEYAEEGF